MSVWRRFREEKYGSGSSDDSDDSSSGGSSSSTSDDRDREARRTLREAGDSSSSSGSSSGGSSSSTDDPLDLDPDREGTQLGGFGGGTVDVETDDGGSSSSSGGGSSSSSGGSSSSGPDDGRDVDRDREARRTLREAGGSSPSSGGSSSSESDPVDAGMYGTGMAMARREAEQRRREADRRRREQLREEQGTRTGQGIELGNAGQDVPDHISEQARAFEEELVESGAVESADDVGIFFDEESGELVAGLSDIGEDKRRRSARDEATAELESQLEEQTGLDVEPGEDFEVVETESGYRAEPTDALLARLGAGAGAAAAGSSVGGGIPGWIPGLPETPEGRLESKLEEDLGVDLERGEDFTVETSTNEAGELEYTAELTSQGRRRVTAEGREEFGDIAINIPGTDQRLEGLLAGPAADIQEATEGLASSIFDEGGVGSESGIAAALRAGGFESEADAVEENMRSFGKGTVQGAGAIANVPALALGAKEGVEFVVEAGEETLSGRGEEFATRSGEAAGEAVEEAVDFARSSPASAGGLAIGSLAGSYGAIRAASRVSPRAGRATAYAIQPGEELLSTTVSRAAPGTASKFPNNRIDFEEIGLLAGAAAASRSSSVARRGVERARDVDVDVGGAIESARIEARSAPINARIAAESSRRRAQSLLETDIDDVTSSAREAASRARQRAGAAREGIGRRALEARLSANVAAYNARRRAGELFPSRGRREVDADLFRDADVDLETIGIPTRDVEGPRGGSPGDRSSVGGRRYVDVERETDSGVVVERAIIETESESTGRLVDPVEAEGRARSSGARSELSGGGLEERLSPTLTTGAAERLGAGQESGLDQPAITDPVLDPFGDVRADVGAETSTEVDTGTVVDLGLSAELEAAAEVGADFETEAESEALAESELYGESREDPLEPERLGRPAAFTPGVGADDELAPGWLSETITDFALGASTDSSRRPSREALEGASIEQRATGELPTYAELYGSSEEREAIEETRALFTGGVGPIEADVDEGAGGEAGDEFGLDVDVGGFDLWDDDGDGGGLI